MADGSVTLTVGAKVFSGWKAIDVTRSIETAAGAFQLTCSDVSNSSARDVMTPGAKCSVQLDGTTVITGYIDETTVDYAIDHHSITVRGRDAASDLVDCSAIFKTGSWSDAAMLQICKDICGPFSVKVSSDVDVSRKISVWNIEHSETAWENIERMARAYGVLVLSDSNGGIRITRPSKKAIKSGLLHGKNILSASSTVSHLRRFNRYIVTSQTNRDDTNYGTANTEPEGTSLDKSVIRYRPLIEIFEDGYADTDVLQKRANWRRTINAGRAQRATINVQGWSHPEGVWQPNILVPVDHPPLGLNHVELLVSEAHYTLDKNGTRTELTLAPAQAYNPEEVPGDLFL